MSDKIIAKQALWNQRFMALADHISQWTEDRDFKVGAVIVGSAMQVLSTGYNGLPRGVLSSNDSRFDRTSGEKFFWFEHAERNAIYNAARLGTPLQGSTIYVNRFPCADCARAIIQCGITHVYSPGIPEFDGALDHSFSVSEILLKEAVVGFTAL